jgi:hypothetical protein
MDRQIQVAFAGEPRVGCNRIWTTDAMMAFLEWLRQNEAWWAILLTYCGKFVSEYKSLITASAFGLLIILAPFALRNSSTLRKAILVGRKRFGSAAIIILIFVMGFFVFFDEHQERLKEFNARIAAEAALRTANDQLASVHQLGSASPSMVIMQARVSELEQRLARSQADATNAAQLESDLRGITAQLASAQSQLAAAIEAQSALATMLEAIRVQNQPRHLTEQQFKNLEVQMGTLKSTIPLLTLAYSEKTLEVITFANEIKDSFSRIGFKVNEVMIFLPVFGPDFVDLRIVVKDRNKVASQTMRFLTAFRNVFGNAQLSELGNVPPGQDFIVLIGPRR